MKLILLAVSTVLALGGCEGVSTINTELATSNDRYERNADIINDYVASMKRLHARNNTTGHWTENLLDGKRLHPGSRITVDIDDGTGECVFTFKATFTNDTDVVRRDLNVCELGWWRVF